MDEQREMLNIETLQVPLRSPVLNPIEHAWNMLQRRLSNHQTLTNTPPALRDIISLT